MAELEIFTFLTNSCSKGTTNSSRNYDYEGNIVATPDDDRDDISNSDINNNGTKYNKYTFR